MLTMSAPLLALRAVSKKFIPRAGKGVSNEVWAVRQADLSLGKGETLALIGESGSGKSTVAQMTLGLLSPDQGHVEWFGKNISTLSGRDIRQLRPRIQAVFQDPMSSLNGKFTVERIVGEALRVHCLVHSIAEMRERVVDILGLVGLPADSIKKYPHAFSGGQRQRIAIARALVLDPEILILDEPLSSLDVSIQAQILELLTRIQNQKKTSFLYISHELSTVHYLAHRVAVMYQGAIVEQTSKQQLFHAPAHAYTQKLLAASL